MAIADPMVMPLALELLACYEQELAKVTTPPASVGIRPGTITDFLLSTTDDECCSGLGWVRIVRFFPSSGPFPVQDTVAFKSGTMAWGVVLELGIVRCSPTPGPDDIPTNAQWLEVTQAVMDASAAMRRAVCCFIDNEPGRNQRVLPGEWQPVPVAGGCVGGLMQVTVRGPACDCADAGPVSS